MVAQLWDQKTADCFSVLLSLLDFFSCLVSPWLGLKFGLTTLHISCDAVSSLRPLAIVRGILIREADEVPGLARDCGFAVGLLVFWASCSLISPSSHRVPSCQRVKGQAGHAVHAAKISDNRP